MLRLTPGSSPRHTATPRRARRGPRPTGATTSPTARPTATPPHPPAAPSVPLRRGRGPDMTARRIAVVTAGLSNPSSTRMLADRLAAATVTALRAARTASDPDGIEAEIDVRSEEH